MTYLKTIKTPLKFFIDYAIINEQYIMEEFYMKKLAGFLAVICVLTSFSQAAFAAAEITVALALGLIFHHFVSEKLREIRGYDAVGSEYFAAAFIAIFVFLILERVREWLWTRK